MKEVEMRNLVIATLAISAFGVVTDEAWAGPKGHSDANINVGGVSTGIKKPRYGGAGVANTNVGNANQKREYPYGGGGGHHGGGGGH
jgi:hypothetical protein